MEYKKAEKLYIKFLNEVHRLCDELSKLENYIPVPFRTYWYLLDMDTANFEKQLRFNSWKTNVTLGFYEVVQSRGLDWYDVSDGWIVLPFGVRDLPYSYDLEVETLVDILTNGELRYNDCGYYDVCEFDDYVKEIYDESEAIEVFKHGLEQIKLIRECKIPKVKTLCDELQKCLDTRRLLEDCKKHVIKGVK